MNARHLRLEMQNARGDRNGLPANARPHDIATFGVDMQMDMRGTPHLHSLLDHQRMMAIIERIEVMDQARHGRNGSTRGGVFENPHRR